MNRTLSVNIIKYSLPILGLAAIGATFFWDWNPDDQIVNQFSGEDREFEDNKASAQAPSVDIETEEGDRYRISSQNVQSTDGTGDFFSGDGVDIALTVDGTEIQLEANSAEIDRVNQVVVFQEDVVGKIGGEYEIHSQEVVANIETRELTTDKPVKVVRSDGYVQAQNFRLSGPEDQRLIEFSGNVNGQLFVNEENNDAEN